MSDQPYNAYEAHGKLASGAATPNPDGVTVDRPREPANAAACASTRPTGPNCGARSAEPPFAPNRVPRVEYAVWQILIHWGWSWDYHGGRIQYARNGSDTFVEAWEAIEDSLRGEREDVAGREAESPT